MQLRESLRLSWRSIRGHKLRSSLTTLGIIIGIAAVIAFVTLGVSLQAGIISDVSPDDQHNIYGWADDSDSTQDTEALTGAQPVFTQEDLDELEKRDGIESAYGYMPLSTQALVYQGQISPQSDALITAGPSHISENSLTEGRQFEQGKSEAVINHEAMTQFDKQIEVGDELTVVLQDGQRTTVTVVGTTQEAGGFSPFEGTGRSPRVYVPTDPFYTENVDRTVPGDGAEVVPGNRTEDVAGALPGIETGDGESERTNNGVTGSETDVDTANSTKESLDTNRNAQTDTVSFLAIVIEAESTDEGAIEQARESARTYLEGDNSNAGELLDDDLEVNLRTSEEMMEQLADVMDRMQRFIVGIATISLVVGSIGIANIMLVSVTERTREIGIMKAVGAQNREILGLFLTEAVNLGVVGSILGTLLGLLAGYLGAWYIDLPLVYPYEYVALAIVIGVLVGILAGLYPAWRAARTDPIDALRYE